MSKYLSTLEEFDIMGKMQNPHLLFSKNDFFSKKNIAYIVLAKKEDEILLINPMGFRDSAVLAGISEKNIEYIAKFGPREYKEIILNTIRKKDIINEILEIGKVMDEDLSNGVSYNQKRIKKVLQYINYNSIVFLFA